MTKLLFLFLSCILFLSSCNSSDEANQYFYSISEELTKDVKNNPQLLRKLHLREMQKYKKSNDKIYLLSSKQIELSLEKNEEKK